MSPDIKKKNMENKKFSGSVNKYNSSARSNSQIVTKNVSMVNVKPIKDLNINQIKIYTKEKVFTEELIKIEIKVSISQDKIEY